MPDQSKSPRPAIERSGPKIAIIRLSAIGDVIHAMPCATALRLAQPDAHIAWIVETHPAQLLRGHPDIDSIITMPRHHWHRMNRTLRGRLAALRERAIWFRHLRMEGFDIAVDMQGLWKSAEVARGTLAADHYCFGDSQARELSRIGVPKRMRITPPKEAKHVIQRYLALLRPLGVKSLEPTWNFGPLPKDALQWLEDWWPKENDFDSRPWVALNPGTGWETKSWPLHHFAALAGRIEKKLGCRALFIWGPQEREIHREFMKLHGGEKFAHAPENTLPQLRALLGGCAVYVGGDTGNTHLAVALDIPCVAPHGGSDWVRNGAFGEQHINLAVEEVPCAPCWRKKCNYVKRLDCLERLTVDRVFEAVETQLNLPGRRKSPADLLGVQSPSLRVL